jgi:helix-turn-helix protein
MVTHTSQSSRILERLKQGPATTMELITDCRVCCPTKRISELRRMGHSITSTEQCRGRTRVVTYSWHGQQALKLEGAA